MLRAIPITILVILSICYCQGELDVIRIPAAMGAPMRAKFASCAGPNEDIDEFLGQVYTWNIKDENKVKTILGCFFRGNDKFEPSAVITAMEDFDKKNEVIKVLEDCNTRATGDDGASKVFSFVGCFMTNTPVMIKL